ncbi:MAG: hypothetical protein N4A35_15115 [Flavobacteriales bacterium]|nr:hypothetical protein [Flavobacteriales bacterium]
MKLLNLILLFSLTFSAYSQEKQNWRLYPGKEEISNKNTSHKIDSTKKTLDFNQPEGTVTIHQTREIDSLTNKISRTPYILGYTVQLEVSQQTSKIRDARYKLLKIQPNAPIEEKYLAPNTYLYGGAFYTRTDAYEFKNEIKNYFPNAIVIAKKMNLPPLEKTK